MTVASSSFTAASSPLADYRAQLRQGFIAKPMLPAEPGIPSPTPAFTRGTMTMVDQGDLRIEVELGPLLVHHLFRGTSRPLQVSVWA
ncbi:hypothetical protein [Ideonella sp. BN130291]|uniref:hypothetical protein n=1 Tax=Ideonella sp. BN130291 TaxID=3112940 RepID=UPI002E276A21|nr:hypothetical protein [Ideonella sp. BN130291]